MLKIWILNATAPVIGTTNGLINRVGKVWGKYIYLRGLYDENMALRKEVQNLRLEAWKKAELVSENKRLSLLLAMKNLVPFKTEGARVIVRNPSFFSETIFINKGAKDGLMIDTPVIGSEGVVGRVISVGRNISEVQLITHSSAAVGVALGANDIQGVANGGGHDLLLLNYIRAEEKVALGDPVVTSGMDGIYPKGLPVGKVIEVREGPSIFKLIKVKPDVHFSALQEVLLIIRSDS